MKRIVIDLTESTLQKIQVIADRDKRSRKAAIEKLIEDSFGGSVQE